MGCALHKEMHQVLGQGRCHLDISRIHLEPTKFQYVHTKIGNHLYVNITTLRKHGTNQTCICKHYFKVLTKVRN